MHTANVATAKNELSRLLRRVKQGESVIITERNHPIACLQPFTAADNAALSPLYEAGVLTPPRHASWDVQAFLATLPSTDPLPADRNLVSAVLAEREESS